MAEIELKPCPFCGESKYVVAQKILTRERWYVHCGNCKCRTDQYLDRNDAIEKWNNRAKADLGGYSLPNKGLFGKRVLIPTGISKRKFVYRVLNDGVRSNAWAETPLMGCSIPTTHGTLEDVLFVVLDTLISEDSRIIRVAKKDIEIFD